MKAACIERSFLSGAQPHIIIDAGRRRRIRTNDIGFHPTLVTPYFNRADISQLPCSQKINGISKMLLASLPLAGLHSFVVSLLRSNHRSAFFNGIPYRLFHIYILTSFAGMYHLQCMPVIGCADDDNINILLFQQLPVISVYFYFRYIDI